MNKTAIFWYVSVFYSLIFMGNAFYSYFGLYYSDIQLNNFDIGLLTTMSSITALCVQPLWGVLADRAKSKNRILMLCLLLTSAAIWMIPVSGNRLWLLLICTFVFAAFQCVINPLSDTITLELAGKSQFQFSRVRTAGSFGFAVMSAAAGWLLDRNIDYMFPAFSIMMFTAFLFSWGIPTVEGHQQKKKVQLKELFKSKQLIAIYIYTFLIQSTFAFFFTFHAVYSKEMGISLGMIGIGIMIGSFSQFPFMIFFDRIYKRFGIYNILLFSGVISIVRWILYATALSEYTILVLWALHGGTFILFYLCLAEYVNSHVQKELKASGQMMNAVINGGVSRICGGLAGGLYASVFGIGSGFVVCGVISAAAVIAFLLYVKRNSGIPQVEKTTAV